MKKIVCCSLMVSMMFITSCGGSSKSESNSDTTQNAETVKEESVKEEPAKEEPAKVAEVIKVTPETTTVKGSLNGCFEVVDRVYKLIDDYGTPKIRVELKRTSAPLPFKVTDIVDMDDAYGSGKSKVFGIGVEFLDADGEVVATENPCSTDGDCLMFSLNTDETATIELNIWDDDNIGTAVKFRVTSIVKENEDKDE